MNFLGFSSAAGLREWQAEEAMPPRNKFAKVITGALYQFLTGRKLTGETVGLKTMPLPGPSRTKLLAALLFMLRTSASRTELSRITLRIATVVQLVWPHGHANNLHFLIYSTFSRFVLQLMCFHRILIQMRAVQFRSASALFSTGAKLRRTTYYVRFSAISIALPKITFGMSPSHLT